jgi:hypothetical protein
LPADRYEEWADVRRQQLRRLEIALLVELAGIYEERGEYGAAIEALTRVTAEEPSHEEAHVALMRLYALSGRRTEALRQYEHLEEAISRELGARLNASSRALREEILSGTFPEVGRDQGSLFEEPASLGQHNLSAPRTSFVGRHEEMVKLKRALAMTRLLTLTGTGGSGKTRLALEVEHDNIRAALSWALEQEDADELGLRLAGALWLFWEGHGHYGEGNSWLEQMLARGNEASVTARAKALEGVGWLIIESDESDETVMVAREGLELSEEAGLGGAVRAKFLDLWGTESVDTKAASNTPWATLGGRPCCKAIANGPRLPTRKASCSAKSWVTSGSPRRALMGWPASPRPKQHTSGRPVCSGRRKPCARLRATSIFPKRMLGESRI